MNFDFQQMKPVIQRDFDRILDAYPTDLSGIEALIPEGGDAYERKRILVQAAAAQCPVRLFGHYPFAFELDVGEARDVCYQGIGNRCRDRSGVVFSALNAFRERLSGCGVAAMGAYYTDILHNTLDHDLLLEKGFGGVYERCRELNATETDEQKRRWRELTMDCCRAVETVGLRMRALARELLPQAADEDERYNLERIAASANTPWEPAVTMFDALNSILCTTVLISGLDGVEMNAYGQLDRLIQPFYQRDLEAGRITPQEAEFLVHCFLHKTDLHCHFDAQRKNYDNGTSVMIGGCDLNGAPVYNDVTRMVLRCYKENRLINPKLNARAGADSPREYLEQLAALMCIGNNNLVVENDDYIIPMFRRMGLSPEDARTYVGNGCQEVICRNQIHSRAFIYLNLPQILLDTLRYAPQTLPAPRREFYTGGCFEKADFEQLYTAFLSNLRACLRSIVENLIPYERLHHTVCPEPMHSAFTADCVAEGRDLAEGGARYTHKTFSLVGFGTLCDSLLSLRRAYAAGTLPQLLAAMEADFAGAEPLRLSLLNSDDRFGHSQAADDFARRLANDLAQVSRGLRNAYGVEWRTSLFTYYNFIFFGKTVGATPDGRHAGETLSRQMNMASVPQLTTAALSMAALTEADFNDVGMFDLTLPLAVSGNDNAQQALADYIRTCLALRLPVLQFSVADVRMLREERQKKGSHPDLIVRVCGYSAVFGELWPELQDDIIARAM